jgi:serine protease Do
MHAQGELAPDHQRLLEVGGPGPQLEVHGAVAESGAQSQRRRLGQDLCLAPTSFAEVAAAARAAVVAIRPTSDTGMLEDVLDEWLEEEWGEDNPTKREEMREELARALRQRSLGSGVIIDPSGLVIASARIVRSLVQVQAVMADGTRPKLTVVGIDDRSDIAVLQLEPPRAAYPHLSFSDSDEVRTGDWILAVGAPFGFDFSVVAGIISSTVRELPGEPGALLQTDARRAPAMPAAPSSTSGDSSSE